MGRNGMMDDDAPTSDAGLTFDERERAAPSGNPCAIVDAGEPDLASGRQRSPRFPSRPQARIGRPPRLTPLLAKQLVAAVGRMGWLSPAARACGVPENVVAEWVSRGRGTHPTRPATRAYADFAHAIERAQADWEASKLALIDTAARTKVECWTAAAWALERHAPERYGRRDHVDVSGTLTVVEMRAFLVAVVDGRAVCPGRRPRSRSPQPHRRRRRGGRSCAASCARGRKLIAQVIERGRRRVVGRAIQGAAGSCCGSSNRVRVEAGEPGGTPPGFAQPGRPRRRPLPRPTSGEQPGGEPGR